MYKGKVIESLVNRDGLLEILFSDGTGIMVEVRRPLLASAMRASGYRQSLVVTDIKADDKRD